MSIQMKDLFISYSSKDVDFVRRLVADLDARGIKVWWDKLEMKIGDSLSRKIQEGISGSSWLAIVLSENSARSPWVERELSAALTKELERQDVFILPILYRKCEIPLFLRDKIYADFAQSYEEGLRSLVERIDPPIKQEVLQGLLSGTPSKITRTYADIKTTDRKIYVEEIIKSLSSSDVAVRISALTGLFTIRQKGVEEYLLRSTHDPSNSVRRFAAFYLGELQTKLALQRMSELISDKSPDVRAAARDAYRKISGQRA